MSTPLWRTALTDSSHDLHQAAWLIFVPGVSVGTTKDRLQDKQEAVIPLLEDIINDDYLFDKEAPGDGLAPVAAIYLIGEWKLRAALPSLLELLEFSQDNEQVREAVLQTIKAFGEDIIGDVIAWGDENAAFSLEATEVLESIGKGNEQAFNWVANWIEKDDEDVTFYVNSLIEINPELAETHLEKLSGNSDFSKDTQKLLRSKARDAKKASKAQLEAKIAQQS